MGHVLIKVSDLKKAVADFEQLGFTVTMGGLPDKAHNALIYLNDGSFIELYSVPLGSFEKGVNYLLKLMKNLGNISASRYLNYLSSSEGMNDYALDNTEQINFEELIKNLKEVDLPMSKPLNKKRKDSQNVTRKWQLSFPKDSRLPFFMGKYSPEIIVSAEQKTHHNNVTGIHEIKITVPSADYPYFIKTYKKLTSQNHVSLTKSTFYFGDTCICLIKGDVYKMSELVLTSNKEAKLASHLTHGVKLSTIQTIKKPTC